MTIALDLRYVAPTSLADALGWLADGDGRSVPLAGGTDLVPWLRDDAVHPDLLVDLKRIPELGSIEESDGALRVGCLVTFSELLASSVVRRRVPVLAEMAGMVASVGIRNRATMAGNLCSAIPCGDAGPVLLVLDAAVDVIGPEGSRVVPIDGWFTGPRRSALRPGELVTRVTIPVPGPTHGAAFARLTRYRGEDLAQASVAVLVAPSGTVRVAFGAVAPTPRRARRIEGRLSAAPPRAGGFDPDTIEDAVGLVVDEVAPITDLRGTARYRLRMCEVMLRRTLLAATARAAGGGPTYGTRLM
jgi:CO/xanthine dehydrogenase FAD-binding subunit